MAKDELGAKETPKHRPPGDPAKPGLCLNGNGLLYGVSQGSHLSDLMLDNSPLAAEEM